MAAGLAVATKDLSGFRATSAPLAMNTPPPLSTPTSRSGGLADVATIASGSWPGCRYRSTPWPPRGGHGAEWGQNSSGVDVFREKRCQKDNHRRESAPMEVRVTTVKLEDHVNPRYVSTDKIRSIPITAKVTLEWE